MLAQTLCLLSTGCHGRQSSLAPAGQGAEQIAKLFWWMLCGGFLIWGLVVGLAVYALKIAPRPHDPKRSRLWIIGGGAIIPTLILTVLLAYGLSLLPGLVRPAPKGSLHIQVTGHQWWWRVCYPVSETECIELANEIRLPVDEVVQFDLQSRDVIHAFWIPSLGGKVDMIPGRQTRLTLKPTKTGIYRGSCAEFCGSSHAWMAFDVVVMERSKFEDWLKQQRQDGAVPSKKQARRGRDVFLSRGCGACHTVRGTPADGVIGPDLTHVGSRLSLAAGTLENSPKDFRDWVAHNSTKKPGVNMPDYDTLPENELSQLAAYLEELQ